MEIRGYKGFDKDFTCRGFKYEVGGEYEKEDAIVCKRGFHFRENPFKVLEYYSPADSRYAVVSGSGEISRDSDDGRVFAQRIRIEKEIGLNELISACVRFILDEDNQNGWSASNIGKGSVASNKGDYSIANNKGDYSIANNEGDFSIANNEGKWSLANNMGKWSVASNKGYHSVANNEGIFSVANNMGSHSIANNEGSFSIANNMGYHSIAKNKGSQSAAINMGDNSAAIVEGKGGIAIAFGYKAKAKACIGSWLVLVDWQEREDGLHIRDVKSFYIDGVIVKADTFYQYEDGQLVEAQ